MFTFLHAADIHLDSPLRGLDKYESAPTTELRSATRRAFVNLVDLAIRREVAFVLIAGDLFDGPRDDYQSALFLSKQFNRLREASIRVFLIAGNHDAANKMTRWLTLPDNARMLDHKRPETIDWPELGVAIHGQGFANESEKQNLAVNYPTPRADRFNIGMLHTSLTGREGHESYAPCTEQNLRDRDYDYWALGHVHTREIVSQAPWIVFPGNPQGRHIREPGAKGCYLVTVDDGGVATLEFEPLDVLRWEVCKVDARDCERPDQVVARVGDRLEELLAESAERLLAARVEVVGETPAHDQLVGRTLHWTNQVRSQAHNISYDQLWIEKVKWRTRPPRRSESLIESDGPLADLWQIIEELRGNESDLIELGKSLNDLREKWPKEASDPTMLDEAAPSTAEGLRQLLDEVEPLLRDRLGSQEDAR